MFASSQKIIALSALLLAAANALPQLGPATIDSSPVFEHQLGPATVDSSPLFEPTVTETYLAAPTSLVIADITSGIAPSAIITVRDDCSLPLYRLGANDALQRCVAATAVPTTYASVVNGTTIVQSNVSMLPTLQ